MTLGTWPMVTSTLLRRSGPISKHEFSQIFDFLKLNQHDKLAIAVSGSPESLALLSLLKSVAPSSQLMAYTFDHGLNPKTTGYIQKLRDQIAKMGSYFLADRRPLSNPVDWKTSLIRSYLQTGNHRDQDILAIIIVHLKITAD
jgi:hypothetical protein